METGNYNKTILRLHRGADYSAQSAVLLGAAQSVSETAYSLAGVLRPDDLARLITIATELEQIERLLPHPKLDS